MKNRAEVTHRFEPNLLRKGLGFLFFVFVTFMFVGNATASCTGDPSDPADLTCGLAGWWQFDDIAGNVAQDSASGDLNPASLISSPAWSKGILNEGALSFNGSNNYLSAGATNIPKEAKPLTVSTWVYLATSPTSDSTIAYDGAWYEGNPANPTFLLSLSGPNHNQTVFTAVQSGNGGRTSQVTSTLQLTLNKWHNVVGVSDGTSNVSVYVDGAVTSPGTLLNYQSAQDTYFPISIGAKVDNAQAASLTVKLMMSVFITVCFRKTEVTSLYNQGTGTPAPAENFNLILLGSGQGGVVTAGQGVNCSATCSGTNHQERP